MFSQLVARHVWFSVSRVGSRAYGAGRLPARVYRVASSTGKQLPAVVGRACRRDVLEYHVGTSGEAKKSR